MDIQAAYAELQEGIDSHPLSVLLPKARELADRLSNQECADWVKLELHGYPINHVIPEYRNAFGEIELFKSAHDALSGKIPYSVESKYMGLRHGIPVLEAAAEKGEATRFKENLGTHFVQVLLEPRSFQAVLDDIKWELKNWLTRLAPDVNPDSTPLPAAVDIEAAPDTQSLEIDVKPSIGPHKVFVVHGHDKFARLELTSFLNKVGLEPIVLHEQPDAGRTIIEKFEVYADVRFAIVLLTPDDQGSVQSAVELSRRARQNVIFELGYFLGKLSRRNVCALYKGSLELPSDYSGVLYIEMDDGGAWKLRLARELHASGLNIALDQLLLA